jgi:hypothetical protein
VTVAAAAEKYEKLNNLLKAEKGNLMGMLVVDVCRWLICTHSARSVYDYPALQNNKMSM